MYLQRYDLNYLPQPLSEYINIFCFYCHVTFENETYLQITMYCILNLIPVIFGIYQSHNYCAITVYILCIFCAIYAQILHRYCTDVAQK